MSDWLLYGATGYTGQLIASEAVRRGHRPILASRSAEKLAPLADKLDLDYRVFSLDDSTTVARGISDVGLVLHAAGPFVYTSSPMLRACVVTGAHYLDITGEYPVFENTFTYDKTALRQKVAYISGVGFDVVPSDCLAAYVAAQMPDANQLDMAFAGLTRASAGTLQSARLLVAEAGGGMVRRDGRLMHQRLGYEGGFIRFSHGRHYALPIPWGDLATAYRSTGIPNITTYMALPRPVAFTARWLTPLLMPFLETRLMQKVVSAIPTIPVQDGRAFLWARATRADGEAIEAWLETPDPYLFTAQAAVRAIEQVFADRPTGALTPAQAFGADFVLEMPGVRRLDAIG